VVRRVRARGWHVTGVTRRPCAESDLVADLRKPIEGWPDADVVLHLAGAYAGCSARELADSDLAMAHNLVAWGRRHGARRFVLASAAEVYGPIEGVADEDWPCRPVIPYGRAKLEIEGLFRAAGFPELAICRLGEVYGPGGRIMRELAGRLRSGFCPWPGAGRVDVSFLHVEDAAEALILACGADLAGCKVYNVADDVNGTWRQFIDEIASLLGTRRAVPLPLWAALGYSWMLSTSSALLGRPATVTPHVLRLLTTPKVLSSACVKETLGFAPAHPSFSASLKGALVGL
jgi:nucleoside-diphosphate-sugar epimerase